MPAADRIRRRKPLTAWRLPRLYGEPLFKVPWKGLSIPPDALRVFLESFEGPLDLLLYLIRRQKFDIMQIPMAIVTEQYMSYVELIRESNLELAADYLAMAAHLMQIKSQLLLPVTHADTGEEVAESSWPNSLAACWSTKR